MLTAFSQREVIEEARDAGALAYLVKPYQKSDLIPAIEVAIGRFREMQHLPARSMHSASSSSRARSSTAPKAC
jgi:response regulator NasT